jgi:hypothetical protein
VLFVWAFVEQLESPPPSSPANASVAAQAAP